MAVWESGGYRMRDLQKIYDYVDAHAQEYIELLQKFCRQGEGKR